MEHWGSYPRPHETKNHKKNSGLINSVAVAGAPGGASFEVTGLVLLISVPANVLGVTFTLKVHVPFGPTLPFDRLMRFVPASAVNTAPDPQLPENPFGVAMIRPDGSVSVRATPVSATALAFDKANDRVAVSPGLSCPKALLNVFVSVGAVIGEDTLAVSVTVALPVPGATSEMVTVNVNVPKLAYVWLPVTANISV